MFIASVLIIACGGSEKEEDEPANTDAGIVVSDAGHHGSDAGLTGDAGHGGEAEIEYISIPAGSFVLSHDTDLYHSGFADTLSAFEMKKTPVTVAEFKKCVDAGACTMLNYQTVSDYEYCNYNRGAAWLNHPMNCVNWKGAKEYCEWVGGRLPSEEEWEYAATHNGTKHLDTTYAFGNTLEHCVNAQYALVDDGEDYTYCQSNAAAPMSTKYDCEGTSDVSLHSPAGDSPLGLVDMTGNVWEWTDSEYKIQNSIAKSNVLKGGSWDTNLFLEDKLAVTYREYNLPGYPGSTYGIRCVK